MGTKQKIYLVQVLLAFCFLSILLLQNNTLTALSTLVPPDLLATAGDAFAKYAAAILLSIPIVLWSTKKLFFESKWTSGHLIAFWALYAFFLYYLIMRRLLIFPVSIDDSYIDYRYVYNWVNGISFDYNPGHRVMGFTSILHLILLSGFYLVFRNQEISVLSQCLNAFCQIITYPLLFFLLWRVCKKPLIALMGPIVFALSQSHVHATLIGKEGPLITLLLLVSLIAMQMQREKLSAWMAVLIAITRPEGIVWLVLCLGRCAISNRAKLLQSWLAPLAVLGAGSAGIYALFGTIVPHGMIGKSIMYFHNPPLVVMVMILRKIGEGCFVPEGWEFATKLASDIYDFSRLYAGVIATLLLLHLGKGSVLRFYGLAVVMYLLLYSITNPWMAPWYYCWFGLAGPLLVPILASALMESMQPGKTRATRLTASMICCLLFAAQICQQPFRPVFSLSGLCFPWTRFYQRVLVYKDCAALCTEIANGRKDLFIATPEIGMLGFSYPGPILDLGGLVSDEVLKYGPPPKDKGLRWPGPILPEIIRDMKPYFVVTDKSFGTASKGPYGLYDQDYFKNEYELVKFFPFQMWSDGFEVYKRKDLPSTPIQ